MNRPIFDFRDRLAPRQGNVVDLDEWLDRGRAEKGPPHPTLLDDLKDLWADIAACPTSHAFVGFAGVVLGLAATLGPALVWSWFL